MTCTYEISTTLCGLGSNNQDTFYMVWVLIGYKPLDKSVYFFFHFSTNTYVVGTQKNRLKLID